MGTTQRPLHEGDRLARRLLATLGEELRNARIGHGLSQATLARAAGTTQARISLFERSLLPTIDVPELCRLFSIVGCEFTAKVYPSGRPIRDRAHLVLLDRLRAELPGCAWRSEQPLPIPGDRRAWDAVITTESDRVGVEAETVLGDVQALERRVLLKLRDDPTVSAAVLLVAGTKKNRQLLRVIRHQLRGGFPLDGPETLDALRSGTMLRENGLLVL